MYRLSRYWNRLAYFFIKMGRKMIWDQTGKNAYYLTRDEFASKFSESIMCDRQHRIKKFFKRLPRIKIVRGAR